MYERRKCNRKTLIFTESENGRSLDKNTENQGNGSRIIV